MQKADGIMGPEGFERSVGRSALAEALSADRGSPQEVNIFIGLQAKMVGAQSVLKKMGQGDSRRFLIAHVTKSN